MMKHDWTLRFSAAAGRVTPPEISWLMAKALEDSEVISLAAGFVDQESLPGAVVSKELERIFTTEGMGEAALQYGTTSGDLELRTLLLERMRSEGVLHPGAEVDPGHLILGSGSQQVLYLAGEALLDEGDIVLVEAPTYFVYLGALAARGARTIGIDTDQHGMIPEQVEACLERIEAEGSLQRVKMLYVMSYATNPLGVTLTLERRKTLLDIVRRYRERGASILLVEDAAYRRLCFEHGELPPIKAGDVENDYVLYTESFSKSLSPGLRLGFGLGPKAIIEKLVDLKGNHDFGTSNFCQQVLKGMLRSGEFDRHTEELLGIYTRKRDIVVDILERTFPASTTWLHPTGGLYTWITLPQEFDTGPQGQVFARALQEKVLYVPGCLCYSPDRPESRAVSSLRISYGMISEELLRTGCQRLAQALNRAIAA